MFDRKIKLNDKTVVKKPFDYSILILLIVIFAVIISSVVTQSDYGELINNFDKVTSTFGDMFFPPDFSKETLVQISNPMLETIQMSIAGTLLGCALAFPVAILASTNINKNKISIAITRFILSLTRTMPVLVYALIITYIFDLGSFAGTIAIIIFTFSLVSKMLFEYIETLSLESFEAMEAVGLSKTKSVILALIPEIIPSFISMSLYSFEINVRSATVLGMVGAGGIGQLIEDSMSLRQYDKVGAIIIMIFVIVVIIESLSRVCRKRLS